MRFNALALCFQQRFEYEGIIEDVHKAISLFQAAASLVPNDDPRLSSVVGNLGGAQRQLFLRTQTQADFDASLDSFTRSTMHSAGSPSVPLPAWGVFYPGKTQKYAEFKCVI